MAKKLALAPKVEKGYTKAREKIDARVKLVIAELYNKYGFEEFTYSSIELSKKCGVREYASRLKDHYLLQTYRGNSISKKMSTYRIRQEHFTPDVKELSKNLFEDKPVELRDVPESFDEMRYVTFNIANIREASKNGKFIQTDRFKLKQLERALLIYGVQEDPNDDNLITLGIPHNQVGCRLYSTWPFCLQNTSADLRQATITGDSIDLDAAAVQCMVDLGQKFGGKEFEIDTLKHYIDNKRTIRGNLAVEYDTPEDTIKCIFNIMVLGGHGSEAQVRANYRDTNSIARVVGDSMKAAEIVTDHFVHAFYMAVKSLRRLIVESMHVEIENGWRITNTVGLTRSWHKKKNVKRHVKPVAKMMNFVYQGWELSMMNKHVDAISDKGLPMHDSREGVTGLEEICDSFEQHDVKYSVDGQPHRFVFPEITAPR